jgi:hypothetical protein
MIEEKYETAGHVDLITKLWGSNWLRLPYNIVLVWIRILLGSLSSL